LLLRRVPPRTAIPELLSRDGPLSPLLRHVQALFFGTFETSDYPRQDYPRQTKLSM